MNRLLLFLTLILSRQPLKAAEVWRLESSFSHTTNAQLEALETLQAAQNTAALRLSYKINEPISVLGQQSRFALGLSASLSQSSYQSREIQNQGIGFQWATDIEWTGPAPWELKLCHNQRLWTLRMAPEILIFSRLATGSYSEGQGLENNLASASVSTWQGWGGWGLRMGMMRRLSFDWLPHTMSLGGSFQIRQAYFQQKSDRVAARSPASGIVTQTTEVTQGSFFLRSQALSFDLSYPL